MENEIGRRVIDLTFQDDKFFYSDFYKNMITNEYPTYMAERYSNYTANKNKNMPDDYIANSQLARSLIETTTNMDIVSNVYAEWI